VEAHYEPLWSYVRFLTGGATDAEDILHQAFLVGHARLARGEAFRGDPGRWLRGVVRNLVHAWWRERRRLPTGLADGLKRLAEQADDAPADAARAELKRALKRCLRKLPDDDRALVSRRYTEGLSVADIAETSARSAVTLRVRLHRIRLALKRCVEAVLSRGGAT